MLYSKKTDHEDQPKTVAGMGDERTLPLLKIPILHRDVSISSVILFLTNQKLNILSALLIFDFSFTCGSR